MKRLPFFTFILAGILFGGCSKDSTGPDQIIGSGKLVSQQRNVSLFTGIRVTGTAKVIIRQDAAQSLRIEADDNIIDRVTTSVENGVLLVDLQQGSYSNITVNVYASMQAVNLLEVVGTAEFASTAPIQTDRIVCRITGTGTITLSGTAIDQTILITGSGSIHNFDLVCSTCSATISGAGNIEVSVTEQLDAVIAGTGSIVYAGNPPVVHQTISGIGSVKPRP